MAAAPVSRGHLNPDPRATVARLHPSPAFAELVRHWWIPEWDLPAGLVRRQLVLTYPAVNLVVEADSTGAGVVALHGPNSAVSYRDLTGSGWALGGLLRAAAVPALLPAVGAGAGVTAARDLVDTSVLVEAPALYSEVAAVLAGDGEHRHEGAALLLGQWLQRCLAGSGAPSAEGLLANRLTDIIEHDPDLLRLEDVQQRLGVSSRTLHRVAVRHTGFAPAALIRRRRLQSAADSIRTQPDVDLSTIAHQLGYADHAHLTRDFRAVLGLSPSRYRAELAESSAS